MVIAHLHRDLRDLTGELHVTRKEWEAEARRVHNVAGDLGTVRNSLIDLAISAHRIVRQAQRYAATVDDPQRRIDLELIAQKAGRDRHAALEKLLTPEAAPDPWAVLCGPQEADVGHGGGDDAEHLAGPPDAAETQPRSTEDGRCD